MLGLIIGIAAVALAATAAYLALRSASKHADEAFSNDPVGSTVGSCPAESTPDTFESGRQEIADLLAAGKNEEALAKATDVLACEGFDFSVMNGGAPSYDPSDPNYGSTPRQKLPEVTVGDAAFDDTATLLTTIAHERKHAEQWSDPAAATAMGSDARELEAYLVEIENEEKFGVDKAMRDNNRSYAEHHYKRLTPKQKQQYTPEYERLIGPPPE
jgi:hypothetical protein